MTAVVSYVISSTENYESPVFVTTDPATDFPAIWGNQDYKFTITFTVTDDELSFIEITSVVANSHPDFVTANSASEDSIRIEKIPGETVFPGEYFEFLSFDEDFNVTRQILKPEEADENQSIVKWNTPTEEIIDSSYTFTIFYTNGVQNYDVTVSYNQELHWLLDPGLAIFTELVNRSKY